jgi:hypothetical protein
MLELHEASITNTLAKDNKVAESSQETTPLAEGMACLSHPKLWKSTQTGVPHS